MKAIFPSSFFNGTVFIRMQLLCHNLLQQVWGVEVWSPCFYTERKCCGWPTSTARLSLWDGPEKHPLWPLSIAIVVYIYVGTSSKKRCECLERLMNMNTTTRKSQYTIKLRYPRSRKKRVLNPDSRASICSGWKMKGGFHLMKCNVVDLLPFRPNYLFVPFLISELILGLVYYHRINFSPSPSTWCEKCAN